MTIRTMTVDDYEDVHALLVNTPGMGLNDVDDSREGITRYLSRNPTSCFVATDEGHIVGVILSGHDGRRGYIGHTAVATSARRRGIGTALVDAALEALRMEGISKVALVVFDRNETGNRFWEHRGFTRRTDLVYRNRALVELRRFDT